MTRRHFFWKFPWTINVSHPISSQTSGKTVFLHEKNNVENVTKILEFSMSMSMVSMNPAGKVVRNGYTKTLNTHFFFPPSVVFSSPTRPLTPSCTHARQQAPPSFTESLRTNEHSASSTHNKTKTNKRHLSHK